jgi:hypothetical protein
MVPGATKPVFGLCRETEMSLCFYTAVDDIRETATEYRLPGSNKKFLWATILAQVAKSDMCDDLLSDLPLDIIRDYLKRPTAQEIISMWLETETGGGADPEELLADCARLDLEMELLAEVTRAAWEEARPKTQKKKKRYKALNDDRAQRERPRLTPARQSDSLVMTTDGIISEGR